MASRHVLGIGRVGRRVADEFVGHGRLGDARVDRQEEQAAAPRVIRIHRLRGRLGGHDLHEVAARLRGQGDLGEDALVRSRGHGHDAHVATAGVGVEGEVGVRPGRAHCDLEVFSRGVRLLERRHLDRAAREHQRLRGRRAVERDAHQAVRERAPCRLEPPRHLGEALVEVRAWLGAGEGKDVEAPGQRGGAAPPVEPLHQRDRRHLTGADEISASTCATTSSAGSWRIVARTASGTPTSKARWSAACSSAAATASPYPGPRRAKSEPTSAGRSRAGGARRADGACAAEAAQPAGASTNKTMRTRRIADASMRAPPRTGAP